MLQTQTSHNSLQILITLAKVIVLTALIIVLMIATVALAGYLVDHLTPRPAV
jgi:hypothetical protein